MSVFFTPEQVADRFQVSRQMVMRLVARGTWPCIKIGKFVRFNEEHIEAIQNISQVEPSSLGNSFGKKTR